jgi:hypothetical protein
MKIMSHPRSLAFGLVLLAVAFGFGGSPVRAQAIEPSLATPVIETDGKATPAMRPETLFCVIYNGGDETCISEVALAASEESEASVPSAVDEALPAVSELSSSATEIDSSSLFWTDAIKVAINQSVTIAAPGEEAESTEPESTGSLPSDAAAGEPNITPDAVTPARNGAD